MASFAPCPCPNSLDTEQSVMTLRCASLDPNQSQQALPDHCSQIANFHTQHLGDQLSSELSGCHGLGGARPTYTGNHVLGQGGQLMDQPCFTGASITGNLEAQYDCLAELSESVCKYSQFTATTSQRPAPVVRPAGPSSNRDGLTRAAAISGPD